MFKTLIPFRNCGVLDSENLKTDCNGGVRWSPYGDDIVYMVGTWHVIRPCNTYVPLNCKINKTNSPWDQSYGPHKDPHWKNWQVPIESPPPQSEPNHMLTQYSVRDKLSIMPSMPRNIAYCGWQKWWKLASLFNFRYPKTYVIVLGCTSYYYKIANAVPSIKHIVQREKNSPITLSFLAIWSGRSWSSERHLVRDYIYFIYLYGRTIPHILL